MYTERDVLEKEHALNRLAQEKRAAEGELDRAYQEAGCVTAQGNAAPLYIAVIDQLRQLVSPTWDGDVIGKTQRDHLVKQGLAARSMGWNFLTEKGVETCIALGILRA